VLVHSAPDGRFRRRGSDLWHTEVLPVEDAALGTKLEIPTLEEPVTVAVPSGTQPGQILRVAGKGLPAYGDAGRGDLMLVIEVEIPRHPDRAERRLFEQLRRLHRSDELEETGSRR
jgi:molecular chaperone DnaJ